LLSFNPVTLPNRFDRDSATPAWSSELSEKEITVPEVRINDPAFSITEEGFGTMLVVDLA
jgi:hypothetical protein